MSGFNTIYDENQNKYVIRTQFATFTPLTALVIDQNANVGICGIASPSTALSVGGTISASGGLNVTNGTVLSNTLNVSGNTVINNSLTVNKTTLSALYIKDLSTTSNATMGLATLGSNATVTVSTGAVTTNSRIFLTIQTPSGTVGSPFVLSRIASTSFTVSSTNINDRSAFAWLIVEPN